MPLPGAVAIIAALLLAPQAAFCGPVTEVPVLQSNVGGNSGVSAVGSSAGGLNAPLVSPTGDLSLAPGLTPSGVLPGISTPRVDATLKAVKTESLSGAAVDQAAIVPAGVTAVKTGQTQKLSPVQPAGVQQPRKEERLPVTARQQLDTASDGAAELTRSLSSPGGGISGEAAGEMSGKFFDASGAGSKAGPLEDPGGVAAGGAGSVRSAAELGLVKTGRKTGGRRDWTLNGKAVEYIGGGGFKDVLAHPDDPRYLVTLFNQAGSRDVAGSRLERDREVSRRKPLQEIGAAPKLLQVGLMEEAGGQRIAYFIQERVQGTTLRDGTAADLPLVRKLFDKLLSARLRLTDQVHMLDNIMVGNTVSRSERRALVVDAGEVEGEPVQSVMDRMLGKPDPLKAFYDRLYQDISLQLSSRTGKTAPATVAAPEQKAQLDPFADYNGAVLDDASAKLKQGSGRPARLRDPPPGYREELKARGAPKAFLKGVLSLNGGSSGPVFRASMELRGEDGKPAGTDVAVKTFDYPRDGKWNPHLLYLRNEIMQGREMAKALPAGWAPRYFGEVDIAGNPSLAMELVQGKETADMTPREALSLISKKTLEQAMLGIELLRRAGWGGRDSPQMMVLTSDQVINGVKRSRGDVVFMDAGALTKDRSMWQTPQDAAKDLLLTYLFAKRFADSSPDALVDEQISGLPQSERLAIVAQAGRAAQNLPMPTQQKSAADAAATPAASSLDLLEQGTRGAKTGNADPAYFKGVLRGLLESLKTPTGNALRGKQAYAKGDVGEITRLQKAYTAALLGKARETVRALGLKENEVVTHGTSLKGLLGMLFSDGIDATSSYRGMSGESAAVWGGYGLEVGASYGSTRGVSKGMPGALVIVHNRNDPITIKQGEMMSRAPKASKDFVAVIVSDGERTMVLDQAALRALAASAGAWRQAVVKQAQDGGSMAGFSEWERFRDNLDPANQK